MRNIIDTIFTGAPLVIDVIQGVGAYVGLPPEASQALGLASAIMAASWVLLNRSK